MSATAHREPMTLATMGTCKGDGMALYVVFDPGIKVTAFDSDRATLMARAAVHAAMEFQVKESERGGQSIHPEPAPDAGPSRSDEGAA